MAVSAVSFFHPPSTSTSPLERLTPLRRPPSPLADSSRPLSAYTFQSSETHLPTSRRRSIIIPSPLTVMAFGFKDKQKSKDKERTRLSSDVAKPSDKSKFRVGSPLRSATSELPSTSNNSLFTLSKPKSLKKKRSLASLLSAATEGSNSLQPVQPARTKSSDAAGTLSAALLSRSYRQRTTEPDHRKDENRPMQNDLRPEPNHRTTRKTARPKGQSDTTYMQAYDPILLENDRYSTHLLRRLNPVDGPSFHDYRSKVPSTVLDLGCGPGQWLFEVANAWTQSLITGFDLVDLLAPEVHNHRNVSFKQGNFLMRPWPFPKQSFELVRMANLSLCIPFDKWELVLSEAQRVLTVHGRLELIDDQIFFPYAPAPTTPHSSRPSTTPPPLVPNRHVSFFDTDEDDTLDGHDDESSNTESTLCSDREMSPSSEGNFKRTPVPDDDETTTYDGDPDPPLILRYDPGTPTSTSSNTIVMNPPEKSESVRPSSWSLDAAACRDLETVFEGMLDQKFGIHTRPSDFLPNVIQKVFGNGGKLRSYHLKLAPKEASDVCSIEGGSEKEEKSSLKVGQMINEITKEWEEKKRLKRANKMHTPVADVDPLGPVLDIRAPTPDIYSPTLDIRAPDIRLPDGLSAKAAERLGLSEEAPQLLAGIPDRVSAKAASRLGISTIRERKSQELPLKPLSEDVSDEGNLEGSSTLPAVPIITEQIVDDPLPLESPSTSDRLSWKAANRLGISYSALTAATAACRRPLSSSSTLVSNLSSASAPCQSPGLIVWPSKFIPLSPSELEMHACKHIHTLLGCRPALADYIHTFVNEDGAPLETDEDLDQAIWEYECFRRRRFNWPQDIPNWDADTEPDLLDSSSRPASAPSKLPHPRSSSETTLTSPFNDVVDVPLYAFDQLTHVRTLRVYEAVKTGEHFMSTLSVPCSPPRSTPPQ